MKNWLSWALVAFFALSCNGLREARTGMDRAESCMDSAPDSALMIVRGIEGNTLPSRSLRARHALLLTMAQDKCYIDVKEDSTIRVAYEYYQRRGSRQEQLLSTYYLGVIRQNAENYIDAALAFRDAEPLAVDLGDNRQLSLIYQHLSRIFSLNYDHVRSLDYAEKALDAAERAGEKLMADFCRYDVGLALLALGEYDPAEKVLKSLLETRNKQDELYYYTSFALARVSLYKPQPDWSSAKRSFSEILNGRAFGRLEKSSLFLSDLSILREHEGNQGAADSLIEKLSLQIHTQVDSAVYFSTYASIMDQRGDWKQAYDSMTEALKLQDRIFRVLLSQSVTHSMEEHYKSEWAKARTRSHLRLFLGCVFGMILLLVIVVLLFLLRYKNQVLLEDMTKIQEVKEDLERLHLNNESSYAVMEKLIADKVQVLQHLSESFYSLEPSAIKKKEERVGWMSQDEIISAFRKQLAELRKDHSFVPALEQSLNLSESNIMRRVRDALPGAKELDYSILTLLFSGFSIKSISYLLNMSESSLRMRKSRYKQQFDALPEPDRSTFLKKLG